MTVAYRESPAWPVGPHPAAYHGPLGDMTRLIEPHTESDPLAVLVQALVSFGSLVGRGAYYQVEATRHHPNEFCILVGDSSKARKGTSFDHVHAVMRQVAPGWAEHRHASGLASGEGIVWRLRDTEPDEDEPAAAGGEDKRLLVVESEFASVLKVARRADNTLSPIVRNAWDGRTLQTLSKTSPARVTDPHIAVIGHITRDELVRNLDATEAANGFLNRFLHVAVRASKSLPFGGDIDTVDFGPVVEELRLGAQYGRVAGRLRFDDRAREVWPGCYEQLRAGHHGLLGAVTARAEAHVVRLALIYAVADCAPAISADHLRAGLALWRYAERSAGWCYGTSLGDPLADELHKALSARPDGMTRKDIRDLFHRNKSRDDIDRALDVIAAAGLAQGCRQATPGGGPARELWTAC